MKHAILAAVMAAFLWALPAAAGPPRCISPEEATELLHSVNAIAKVERLNAAQTAVLAVSWDAAMKGDDLPILRPPHVDESLIYIRGHDPIGWIVQFKKGCAVAEGPMSMLFFAAWTVAGRGA